MASQVPPPSRNVHTKSSPTQLSAWQSLIGDDLVKKPNLVKIEDRKRDSQRWAHPSLRLKISVLLLTLCLCMAPVKAINVAMQEVADSI